MGEKIPEYLTEEEITKLLDTPYKTEKVHRMMLKVAYKFGLRNSEVCHLKRGNFDLGNRNLYVREGKGSKDRTIPIPIDMVDELRDYFENNDLQHDDRLFSMSERGFGAMVKRYGNRAGIMRPVYPHLLRHSYAVHRLQSGANIRSVQKALGHKYLTTTQVYLNITDEDVKDDFDRHPLPV